MDVSRHRGLEICRDLPAATRTAAAEQGLLSSSYEVTSLGSLAVGRRDPSWWEEDAETESLSSFCVLQLLALQGHCDLGNCPLCAAACTVPSTVLHDSVFLLPQRRELCQLPR